MSSPKNLAAKETVRKIHEKSLIATDHPVATSTPTYNTRNRQRKLSLESDAFVSKNSSLVDRVPLTFEDIRRRKSVHDPSSPKTQKLPMTRARKLPNSPVRVTTSENSPKSKTPDRKKTTKKTLPKTEKTTQNIPAIESPIIIKVESPAVESPINLNQMSPKILSKNSRKKSIVLPEPQQMSQSKPSEELPIAENEMSREVNSPEEVSNEENAAAEDISEPPLKQPRLNIFQVATDHPVATSTPNYNTRNRQRKLSLDSDAFVSKNSSLVDRVPLTFEDIRRRKGIHDPSSPVRATTSENSPKSKTPESTIIKVESPAVESPIDLNEMSPKILSKNSPKKSIVLPEPQQMSPSKPSEELPIAENEMSREVNSPEVSNEENAAAVDISEPPLKQPRLNIFQVNLGSPFSMMRSKKPKAFSVELNDENQESYEAPPVNLSDGESIETTSCSKTEKKSSCFIS